MASWEGLDRRKFPRVNYPCLVTVRYNGESSDIILTHTENIGIGGVCVILKKNIKLFTPVELEVDLLDTEEHVKCAGKVVWSIRRKSDVRKKPLFYDIGIEFSSLSEADQRRLDEIVQRLVQQGSKTPHR